MTNWKIEGQCAFCENMANGEILDENCLEYVEVCDDCFTQVFKDVADNGAQYFHEWAEEMFGSEKACKLTGDIFGQQALYYIIGDDDMSKKKRKNERMIPMFTYGILKYPHNIAREGGINIIENCTLKGHKMYLYNSSFPITRMTNNPKDVIYGTLFEVPESQVLYSYDYTEGYNPKAHPSQNMYNRIEVEVQTPTGETKLAQFYYCNQHMFAEDLIVKNYIPTGNFDDRQLAKSYGLRKNRKGGK
jgi:gamma-glutamylcyclotransferase (GGCT)/AIG2-like uncharacterized protein YtfP